MALIGKALLGGLLLVIAIVALIVAGDALGVGQGAQALVIAVLIVAGVLAYALWSQKRIRATYRTARNELLTTSPVVYVGGLETLGGAPEASVRCLISSDADEMAVWAIDDGEVSELTRMPRDSVAVERDRVQTAVAKKYDGIRLSWGSRRDECLGLALYSETFWGMVFPIRGTALDTAMTELERGAPLGA